MMGKFNRTAPGNCGQQQNCKHAGTFDWATEKHLGWFADHGSEL